ncbi:DUF5063 domain-containing protein [Kallotenue papyrolyticum]|uniref:DUF5063 domain-containing protein n=1 Tax=Kallotenue papyrolyticum TaxID=1325125 RepID=UPI0005BB2E00|nr:DUF5063 domain-containing protein [Kallotenue papyrolyticum]
MDKYSNLKEQPTVVHFVESARTFCRLVETDAPESDLWMLQILVAVADLYAAAHHLPVPDLDSARIDPEDRFDLTPSEYREVFLRLGRRLGENRYYPYCFDSTDLSPNQPPPGIGDLADDLADIYRDIKPGLRAWDANIADFVSDIIFEWKEPLFRTHWGRHAVDVLRVLHSLVYK